MALVCREHYLQFAEYAVWKIEESPEFYLSGLVLSHWETGYLNNIAHPQRKLTWLASRYVLKLLFNTDTFIELLFDEHGKPFVANADVQVSISHCDKYAAAMVGKQGAVGIDVETTDRDISRISRKFLSDSELKAAGEESKAKKLMIYWGAKEVIYKIYGKRKLEFRDDMYIKPFILSPRGDLYGMLMKQGYLAEYLLHYTCSDEYLLVVGVEKEVNLGTVTPHIPMVPEDTE